MEKEKSYQERMNKTTDYKFDAIKEYLKDGIKILDYGSGYNQEFIKKVKETGALYFAYDKDINVQKQLNENNVETIDEYDMKNMIGEFDIIFMSSVIHEIESFEGNINKTKIFDNIHNLLKVDGVIIIRDWGFSKSKMKSPETIMITSKDALEEVRIWIKALYDNNIIQPYEINEEDLEIKVYKKSDVYEIIFHSVWGLQSVERESEEQYAYDGLLLKHLLRKHNSYDYIKTYQEYDRTYLQYIEKYFEGEFESLPTKSVNVIKKTKN